MDQIVQIDQRRGYVYSEHDLIDVYKFMLHPVVVGSGKRLFREGIDKKALRLVDTKSFRVGIVILNDEPVRKEA